MKRYAIGLFIAALWTAGAGAQTQFPQTLPANTVWGRLGIGSGPGQAIPFSVLGPNLQIAAAAQRRVVASPITVLPTDFVINVNISSGSPLCALPTYAGRKGVPLTFKDVAGNFAAHPLTITANGAETIDGQSSVTLSTNYQSITLVPANDGTTTGWLIQ